ncbi:ABC transporter substrate-binding protein [Curtobacterium sp. VKM Ac-1395]|jgi:raffinose/stachyose/melibiose transport system substrate-binding protein|uniref:ABC transporter substrate-binding protein n=1 Tax=Curtobacterium sp. VKM Ac-1395 TaxID=2783815 RepID=UPI00188B382F|nr:extracellular solute-binding protein [Curtobacterium sp. VKM Ac-1395]MBF4590730.1 extracellular solute-binding protein [Curtobacterium sp. VKM Ac-1395]
MKIPASSRKIARGRVKTRAAAAVVAVGVTIALAACSAGGGAASNGAISAWSTTADKPNIQPSIAEWNKSHPEQEITADYFGTNDFKDKIRTAVNSPQAPTLVYNWGGGTLKSYVKAGLVKDISKDLAGEKDFTDKIVPSIADTGKIDGKTYAIPASSTAPVVLYMNKDVLAKAGISEAPATWDDLLTDVKKLKAAGQAPISLGGQSKWPYLMWIEYLVDRIGGPQPFQAILDGKPDAWSDPAVIKATTMIQQLIKAGGYANGYASVSADTNADLALMVTGRAGFLLQGTWAYSGISGIDKDFVKDGKLEIAPFPAVEGGKGDPKSIAGNPSVYWSVSSKASPKQTKAALDYVTSNVWNDSYVKTMIDQGQIPPVQGVAPKLKGDFSKQVEQMITDAPSFQQSWDLALSPAASTEFWTQLDLLFNGSSTPKQFSDAMNKTIGK